MKAKSIITFVILLISAVIFVYLVFIGTKEQTKRIADLEKEISFLKEDITPIRYKILSQDNENTELSVKYYDLDGNEFATKKYNINGSKVSFDFFVVKIEEKYVAFPSKIFSDKIATKDGINIFSDYEKNKYPMIFYSKDANKAYSNGIISLFEKIRVNDIEDIENIFGNSVQNINQLNDKNDLNKTYKIIVHTKGGIEIVEE